MDDILGNSRLADFDVCIIGSGVGGSTAAQALTAAGLKVCMLEAGDNYFLGLDDPSPDMPVPLFSNDELKLSVRAFIQQDSFLEPRTFRATEGEVAQVFPDVNVLPKIVGGGAVHADMKVPRFNEVDFRLGFLKDQWSGTSFADWPLGYDELEPFYAAVEAGIGVQGIAGANPFESARSNGFPMSPGVPMYAGLLAAEGARKQGYVPFPFPTGVNSRFYRGRPPCVDCGYCSGYGCPNNSKGSPAVTALREALLSGNCQLRFNSFAIRLVTDARRSGLTGVEYIDPEGKRQMVKGDRFILAASAIESARLCLLSDPDGQGLGNSSGQVGRNLMFHFQTMVVGIFPQRLHGHRGRAVTHGMADFRGVSPGGTAIAGPLGGIIEFQAGPPEPIMELGIYAFQLPFARGGEKLKNIMRSSPFRDHLLALGMQGEDAPQHSNRVDLDPHVRDVYGFPVARITYKNHPFEIQASNFYAPKMLEIVGAAGGQFGFIVPVLGDPPTSRHIMGTLRMGHDPRTSVCDRFDKFHDLDNLFCADGGVFVTSSGYNPSLTIAALALRMAGNIISPGSPERILTGAATTHFS